MTHKTCQRVTVPEAYVTKGRQRVKQYGTNVYLKNKEEFEIELFNPLATKILAQIKLNGKSISNSGIVLRPGERVFLERYLDEAKKFLFETYEVEGDNPDVKNAIRNNGDLEVEFFEEYISSIISYSGTATVKDGWLYPYTYTSDNTNNIYYSSTLTSGNIETSGYTNLSYSNTKSIETGRVEKGSNSNQKFVSDETMFNSYSSWTSRWKLLPESQRHVTKEDLVVYCTNCGTKRKKSTHKFCPNCGNQF